MSIAGKGQRSIHWTALWLLFLAGAPLVGSAQPAADRARSLAVEIQRARSDIDIDGRLDEAAWQTAEPIRLAYERYPEANADPPVQTTCYITYTRQNLYVAFKASDPSPETIRAHLMDRDHPEKLRRDDHVGITLDPFGNEQWGLQFQVNPLGVQADAVYSNQRNSTDYSWDAIWQSRGRITGEGYRVEIRIPFSSINTPADSLQHWRFGAFRNYPRSVRYRIRSHPVDLDRQSLMAQFNRIRGIEQVSSGLNLNVNPVITAKRTDRATSAAGGLDSGPVSLNPGGTIEWGIQPNLNLSATVNPDFSQVEADALQLRENRRFALSFPEKRPFFLESSEIFETPLQAVFTRSMVEPGAGLKLTGKSGPHSFGAFVTRDQRSRLLFPAHQYSERTLFEDRSYSEIFRYRRRISSNAAIGFLGEGRQAPGSRYFNYVGGLDGYLRFLESNTVQFQYLRSSTRYTQALANSFAQPRDSFGGDALNVNLEHSSRNWGGQAVFTSVSTGFRNDNGFFPRANARKLRANGQHIIRGTSSGWYSSIRFGPAFEVTTDQSGRLSERSLSFSGTYRGPLQSEIYAEYTVTKQRFGGRMYPGLDTGVLFFRIQPSGIISKLRLYAAYGGAVDYSNRRRARELIIHPGLMMNLGRNLNLEIDPNYQRLSRNGVTTFNTYLLGTRLEYHFNKRTFIRSILQYRHTDRNLDAFVQPSDFNTASESFFYQLLFSYKVNPQSKLYLGYSSGYGGVNDDPLRIQNRTGYLKVGYAWVF